MKLKLLFWLNAIFYILFGLALLFEPATSLRVFIIVFSIEAIISWIVWSVFLIQEKDYLEDKWLITCWVILQIIAWVLLLIIPDLGETIIKIFVIIFGISVVIKGIILIFDSIEIKKAKLDKRRIVLVVWILLILLGCFLIFDSLTAVFVFNALFWIWMIVSWVSMIARWFQLKKTKKRIKKNIKNLQENWIEIEIIETEDE